MNEEEKAQWHKDIYETEPEPVSREREERIRRGKIDFNSRMAMQEARATVRREKEEAKAEEKKQRDAEKAEEKENKKYQKELAKARNARKRRKNLKKLGKALAKDAGDKGEGKVKGSRRYKTKVSKKKVRKLERRITLLEREQRTQGNTMSILNDHISPDRMAKVRNAKNQKLPKPRGFDIFEDKGFFPVGKKKQKKKATGGIFGDIFGSGKKVNKKNSTFGVFSIFDEKKKGGRK